MGDLIVGRFSTPERAISDTQPRRLHLVGRDTPETMEGVWDEALTGYANAQRAGGRSHGTIRLHRHYLTQLSRDHATPWRVTRADLEKLLAREGWMPETRKSARAAVRGFYAWAHSACLVDADPSTHLAPVRVPPPLPRPAPESVVDEVLGTGGRVRFMGMLAAFCGLRRGEVSRVNRRDLLGDQLVVHGKGGKVRIVPVESVELLTLLAAIDDPDGWAFPNGRGGHLTPGHVGKLMAGAMPADWSAHNLRHRMATTAYDEERDVFALQRVLGHAHVQTTLRYVELSEASLRRVVAAATKGPRRTPPSSAAS